MQNLTQPLHLIQQHIALLHHRLALRILETRSSSLDDAVYLVDRSVQAPSGDEARQFARREMRGVSGVLETKRNRKSKRMIQSYEQPENPMTTKSK